MHACFLSLSLLFFSPPHLFHHASFIWISYSIFCCCCRCFAFCSRNGVFSHTNDNVSHGHSHSRRIVVGVMFAKRRGKCRDTMASMNEKNKNQCSYSNCSSCGWTDVHLRPTTLSVGRLIRCLHHLGCMQITICGRMQIIVDHWSVTNQVKYVL